MDVFSLIAFIGAIIVASSVDADRKKSSDTHKAALRQSEGYDSENISTGNQKDKSVADHNEENQQECDCTPFNLCKTYKSTNEDVGHINIRNFGPCNSYLEVCCSEKLTVSNTQSNIHPYEFVTPDDGDRNPIFASSPTPDYNTDEQKCGAWNKNGVGFRIYNGINGETQFGEFPSVVAIFKEIKMANGEKKLEYYCGGSLIKTNVVLTTTHCVINIDLATSVVRAGEWDLKTEGEVYAHQDLLISDIVTHPDYYSGGLYNDIALIFTEKPFTLSENVQIMCLPEENDDYMNHKCFSAGWGKAVSYNNYSIQRKTASGTSVRDIGHYEVSIMKKVELPIVDRDTCMESLRTTRLGPKFKLHNSFMCAGGERGIDTCKGDGGSPLMCLTKGDSNYLVQVGIVAWGIECGLESIPGVYVNVAGFRQWIDKEIENHIPPV